MNWIMHGFKYLGIIFFTLNSLPFSAQVSLRYTQNETVTWQEAIDMYRYLDDASEEAKLLEIGTTDAGRALHLFVISKDKLFSPEEVQQSGKTILFINNGIHPGESCGVDASLKLASDLLSGQDRYAQYLENTVILIVPIFNVGGALNRSPYHRANQNGPIEHGFRGNARNLDLNRDFIKLDSRNTQSLVPALRAWDPHIFVDTHTSNGADYPYTITLINSHEQRHEASQSAYLENILVPELFKGMKVTPYKMSPYVWSYRRNPENGIIAFMDYPRYTSGYVSLFNTFAFTVETHMFKPFKDRVLSTWHLLREALKFSSLHQQELSEKKKEAWNEKMAREEFILQWALDTSRRKMIRFSGYKTKTARSKVTGKDRYYFDREDPWEKEIPYYKYFSPEVAVNVPEYYVLPSAWTEVVERMKLNRVRMYPISHDTVMEAEVYYIESYETVDRPYNGHYRHHSVKVRKETQQVPLLAGAYLIPARQKAIEYLVQTLEPRGYDSFFSWNFFDEILFRNEYFSPYIFEETAEILLKENPGLRREFEKKKAEDEKFASNAYGQLRFIYERSPWSEPTYMRYPVYRLFD
ncbi:MAG: M14 family zinc carboxypeptidase [Bacteroidota bacterium]